MTKARDLGDFISDGTIAETVTADGLNLGDNEKIQLGAGQDLAIYHDGNTSRIDELGTGNLDIRANDFRLMAPDDTVIIYSDPDDNNSIGLYHQGNLKIKTASTGVNVTGTVAVSGDFNATSGTFTVQSNGTDILNVTSTEMTPQTDGAISLGSATNGFNNMYLDGSAYVGGNVLVGATSGSSPITLQTRSGEFYQTGMQINSTNSDFSGAVLDVRATSGSINTTNGRFLRFYSDNGTTERFHVTGGGTVYAAGNVGVGTSSPSSFASTTLEISGSSTTSDLKLTNTTTGTGNSAGFDLELNGSDINYVNRTASGNQKFWTNSTERFRIGSSGQLGIGGATYGTSGQVLTSGGSGAAPTWADASSGGTFDFVASGSISNGDTVSLNPDGTVSVVSGYSAGSETAYISDNTQENVSTFDSNSNKVVVAFRETTTGYPTVAVGTVSGTSISFGTPVVAESLNSGALSMTFDSNSNKVVLTFKSDDDHGRSIVGTVSGTSISFGSSTKFMTSGFMAVSDTVFDSNSNKVVVFYWESNANNGRAVVGTVSGTSISFGTSVIFNSGQTANFSAAFDPVTNKVLIAYQDGSNSEKGAISDGTVSGTSITFGSEQVFYNFYCIDISLAVSSTTNDFVIILDNGTSSTEVVAGTYNGSNFSFGTAVTIDSARADNTAVTFVPSINKYAASFVIGPTVRVRSVTVEAGNVPILGSVEQPVSDSTAFLTSTYDSSSNRVVLSFRDSGDSDAGKSLVLKLSNSSALVGVATSDVSSTATGTFTISGGVNESLTGLAPGTKYYTDESSSGAVSPAGTVLVGRALSSTKLLLV